ncbi:pyridoxine 5'-phosphate synthase [Marinomonas mediterranea]|jgi:pyridoxine 5''-phosphate synthase (EC 2.6.99.2)|uniref:Pyridoxine 5'-phosphate synthase n=1 Tax=Marinomonas mediterranea (strain ATCC 700492 / JCM 21426 / NBRC 103028 / MMB-1) TaxID=717774 RepID=F2JY25_MARM1|nr:pyridoxine 5'-phosphate synthase [Marinomonas mediterranea]ADZ90761.1 pyridoxal phosphate biosynthetic protein PdxJ [Marinomonas mediterranea MMB-1]WCN08802.1 pyridoxine 5'-phosphate synthase [Marinomonas mediterranea]WCN16916.1 pyridoxine 5'-phosphate synthase [Marinomonas mediterranea MMB-1]
MTHLSVNLNKIGLLRNSRGRDYPNVVEMAKRTLDLGAFGVTIHPRPDQRHATYKDAHDLKNLLKKYPGKELNIEGFPDKEFLNVVLEAQPDQCTLVPDDPNQLTSDHGWNIARDQDALRPVIGKLKAQGIRVVLFMDPIAENMKLAKEVGADRVELYTEEYASQYDTEERAAVLQRYQDAAQAALDAGLGVNAGHDLDLSNVEALCENGAITEVSIGHALTVEALEYGWDNVVKMYLEKLS